ncbi:MAG: hypothetical protein RIF37_17720 [Rhodospirillaceae bacterium]
MIIKLYIGAVLSVLTVTAVQAQPAMEHKGPMGPMGRGGGGVSPVMMTCGADLKQFCDGKRGMPGVQCLMENITDISEPCADALDEASANMGQGHGNTEGNDEGDVEDDPDADSGAED